MPTQLDLFTLPPVSAVGSAPICDEVAAIAAVLPGDIYLGTSSWSFPGWANLVYDRAHTASRLAQEGLSAYARHPLLRAVSIDRSYYGPVDAKSLRSYHDAVPSGFRFVMKAHEYCTLRRFPRHDRYGARSGHTNPLFLDPAYAIDQVVGPFSEGLGEKGALLLFQFAPQTGLDSAPGFADQIGRFLDRLPRGPRYGIELRNPELLQPAYSQVLAEYSVTHCFTVHPTMPSLPAQSQAVVDSASGPLFVRWMLGPGLTYESALATFAPFAHLQNQDPSARRSIADLVAQAHRVRRPAFVLVNNKAEGSAPLSVKLLAREITARLATASGDDAAVP